MKKKLTKKPLPKKGPVKHKNYVDEKHEDEIFKTLIDTVNKKEKDRQKLKAKVSKKKKKVKKKASGFKPSLVYRMETLKELMEKGFAKPDANLDSIYKLLLRVEEQIGKLSERLEKLETQETDSDLEVLKRELAQKPADNTLPTPPPYIPWNPSPNPPPFSPAPSFPWGEPRIPSIPGWPEPYKLTQNKCSVCGVDLSQGGSYVCGNYLCPSGGVVYCASVNAPDRDDAVWFSSGRISGEGMSKTIVQEGQTTTATVKLCDCGCNSFCMCGS